MVDWAAMLFCDLSPQLSAATPYLHCELLCSSHLHVVVGSLLEAYRAIAFDKRSTC